MTCATCRYWWQLELSQPILPPARPEFAPRKPRMGMCKVREEPEFTSRYGKCKEWKQ